MIREKFFSDPNSGYAKLPNKGAFDHMWKYARIYEETTGLSLDNGLTREQYIDLLNSLNIRKTIMYKNYKSALLYYIRYLIASGVLSPEQEDILASVQVDNLVITNGTGRVQYYKNVNMLHAAIQVSVKVGVRQDEALYDPPAAMLYLMWYGLTEQEIVDFPKANVLNDGLILHGEKRQVPDEILNLFIRLRDAEGYYQQARYVIHRRYVASDYLIRSERNSQLTVLQIRNALNRFNDICDRIYSFQYNVIRESGIFYRASCMEQSGIQFNLDDPAEASKIFCEDLTDKNRRLACIRDYALFKSCPIKIPGVRPTLS